MLLPTAFFVLSRPKPSSTALWEAVLSSNYDAAMLLVRAGADVNALRPNDKNDESMLHHLAKRPNNEKCKKLALLLLDYGANPNVIDDVGDTALHYAVRNNSIELVEKLLRRGAKVDVNNKYNVDILFDATMNSKRRELLLLLLKYDVPNEETKNKRGITALKYVIQRFFAKYDEGTIRAILDLGLPVNQTEAYAGWTALHYATVMNNVTLVNLLLEYGADVSTKSEDGIMPLSYACGRRTSAIMKIFIEHGSNIHECCDDDGKYPIHYACSYESVDNIRFLLQRNVNINVTDKNGATPFSLIKGAFEKANQIIIKHLAVMFGKGINVNNRDLSVIYKNGMLREFYSQCLEEVQRMKENKIIGCISFFDIVSRTFVELAFLARNEKFVKNFYQSERANIFPVFSEEMDIILENAIESRNKLNLSEIALCESLSEILPELVLDKITFYMYLNELH